MRANRVPSTLSFGVLQRVAPSLFENALDRHRNLPNDPRLADADYQLWARPNLVL
jgi:hypothetical protein